MSRDEIEKQFVGCVLQDPKTTIDCAIKRGVKSHEFLLHPFAREAYKIALELSSEYADVDHLAIYTEAQKRQEFQNMPAFSIWLAEAVDNSPVAASIDYYADLIVELAAKEALGRESDCVRQSLEKGISPTKVARIAAERFKKIAEEYRAVEPAPSAAEVIDYAIITLMEKKKNGAPVVKFGVPSLDNLVQLEHRTMTTIAARPGIGKTSLLGQLALNSAMAGVPTLFISLEMPVDRIVHRCLANLSGLTIKQMREMTPEQLETFNSSKRKFSQLPLFFQERGKFTAHDFEVLVGKMRDEENIGLVILDYVQLMLPGKKCDTREQEVATVSAACRYMAAEHDIPVVIASQLNRAVEKSGTEPRLSDLRESGSLENDSDIVIFLHKNGAYDVVKETQVIVAKNRSGSVGKTSVWHRQATFSFIDKEKPALDSQTSYAAEYY